MTETLLLTGATGVVGSRFLLEELRARAGELILLVRGASVDQAEIRVEKALQAYDPGFSISRYRQRLRVFPADLHLPRLGLDSESIVEIRRRRPAIIHAAANTDLMTSLKIAHRDNVGVTENVIAFARETGCHRLFYISSFSVLGDLLFRDGVRFGEDDFNIGQRFGGMPYQESKFLAEAVVRSSGMAWSIIRLGQIFGDSETGAYPRSAKPSFFNEFVRTIVASGIAPVSDYRFDVTPVDYAARGVSCVVHAASSQTTYHLCDPRPLTLDRLADELIDAGYALERVSVPDYQRRFVRSTLRASDGEAFVSSATAMLRAWFRNPSIDFCQSAEILSERTREFLSRGGYSFPVIGPSQIRKFIEFGA